MSCCEPDVDVSRPIARPPAAPAATSAVPTLRLAQTCPRAGSVAAAGLARPFECGACERPQLARAGGGERAAAAYSDDRCRTVRVIKEAAARMAALRRG